MNEKKASDRLDGRSVLMMPESRPSNVAKRNIVSTKEEHEELTKIHIEQALARRAMDSSDVDAEINEYEELERQYGKSSP
ncbi:hypothetical protein [Amycolatopsis vastitatis]|uniref:hypothetical protein n=1 Tax=Amycolatopsis vastitatis TaxID=1905142 RepID=UPI0011777196|nr:hypothetical protein [Amycolatopsis vastitatis]